MKSDKRLRSGQGTDLAASIFSRLFEILGISCVYEMTTEAHRLSRKHDVNPLTSLSY